MLAIAPSSSYSRVNDLKKVYLSTGQIILGADDPEFAAAQLLRDQQRCCAQRGYRGMHIGPDREGHQVSSRLPDMGTHERLQARTDAIDD
ncbi:MAG: hypothetical protein V9E93_08325 [Steroidobacteraceae bacterium]